MAMKCVKKETATGSKNPELASASVSRLEPNIESIFSITSFVRIDVVSATRLDTDVELTLSIISFTRIDTARVTRLNANIESMFSSALFVRIDTLSGTRLDAEVEGALSNCIIHKNRYREQIRCSRCIIIKTVSILRLDSMIVRDMFVGSCR